MEESFTFLLRCFAALCPRDPASSSLSAMLLFLLVFWVFFSTVLLSVSACVCVCARLATSSEHLSEWR